MAPRSDDRSLDPPYDLIAVDTASDHAVFSLYLDLIRG
jgi:hypothetical protein